MDQFQDIRLFYHHVIDGIVQMPYGAGWIKDVYPSPDFLLESIDNEEMFIAMENEKISAAMVLNHSGNESYREYDWPTAADDSEVMVIHALGVDPEKAGKGYGRKMVRLAIDTARQNQQKVIRLDVLKGNVPAERLYSGMGFCYLHTLPMFTKIQDGRILSSMNMSCEASNRMGRVIYNEQPVFKAYR